jgi:hypothetical protein
LVVVAIAKKPRSQSIAITLSNATPYLCARIRLINWLKSVFVSSAANHDTFAHDSSVNFSKINR